MPLSISAIGAAEPRERQYTVADGYGLALYVLPNVAKYWRFRYRFEHRAKMLSLETHRIRPWPRHAKDWPMQKTSSLGALTRARTDALKWRPERFLLNPSPVSG
jgi:hypothetical protein